MLKEGRGGNRSKDVENGVRSLDRHEEFQDPNNIFNCETGTRAREEVKKGFTDTADH